MSQTVPLLIRNAQVLMSDDRLSVADVLVEGGRIVAVERELAAPDGEFREINAEGLTLLPGVIDPQVHFRSRGWNIRKICLQPVVPVLREGSRRFWRCPIRSL